MKTTNTAAAHILGRLAYTAGRPLHLAVAESPAEAVEIRKGWHAARAEDAAARAFVRAE